MSLQSAWTLILPVKQTAIAKSRLHDLPGLVRQRLALAFAQDAVSAAMKCPEVRRVVVVTNDPGWRQLADLGAEIVADLPDAGLNPALEHAAGLVRRRDPGAAVAAMSADLPAVRAADLSAAFNLAPAARWFVSDRSGEGTTLLAAAAPAGLAPSFGTSSRAVHRASGAEEVDDGRLERLRLDVDTSIDLELAVGLGVGAFTAAALAANRLPGALDASSPSRYRFRSSPPA